MSAATTNDDEEARLLQNARADLASLSRVSHRLAMIDSADQLQSVLDKLLARLLQRVGLNHQTQQACSHNKTSLLHDTCTKTHAKLIEIFSHTMKRVRDDRSVKLNCESIIELLLMDDTNDNNSNAIDDDNSTKRANPSVNPFTLNLALAFLTLGLPRCNPQEILRLLPGLIVLHGYYAQQALSSTKATVRSHWHQFSHLLLQALESSIIQQQQQQQQKQQYSQTTSTVSKKPKLASPSSTTTRTATRTSNGSMGIIHAALRKDAVALAALYDLMLDLLLYQTTPADSTVPPPGCSQAGQNRWQSNKAWRQEMSPPARLSMLKARLLNWVAPTKHTCLFPKHNYHQHIMTLLLVALGDSSNHPQVANDAGMYIKQYLETLKQQQNDNDAMQTEGVEKGMANNTNEHSINLLMQLLVLCVGFNNAGMALSSTPSSLGLQHNAMQFSRIRVSDVTFAVLMSHVDMILTEQPQLFALARQEQIEEIGTLVILASSKVLGKLQTSTGLTALRGKPYVSAAKVLNSLVIRFLSSLEQQQHQEEDEGVSIDSKLRIENSLAKALGLACKCLSSTVGDKSSSSSSTNASTASSEGNLSVRDALYGVICSLARAKQTYSWLFALGKQNQNQRVEISAAMPSIETAALLFSCIIKEEQSLLPRATAALDALLAGYCRAITPGRKPDMSNTTPSLQPQQTVDNPWSTASATDEAAMEVDESPDVEGLHRQQLAKSLLPLLWAGSQPSKQKASRLAAARWSAELLKKLDLTNACHILCFLAGDKDVTVASIAKRGLGLDNGAQLNNTESRQSERLEEDEDEEADKTSKLGDFSVLTNLLFSQSEAMSRPTFWEFQPKAKASSIAYLLKCLLNDFYGGDDESVYAFVAAITKSIVQVAPLGRDYVGLLDECASSLSACLSTSLFARRLIFEGSSENQEPYCLSFGLKEMEKFTLNLSSSYARRDLACACGYIYGDTSLWKEDGKWLSSIVHQMETCLALLTDSQHSGRSQLGSIHGAAFLGATCAKEYRLNPLLASSDRGWECACQILSALGGGTTVSDDTDGKAFTDALLIALSYKQGGDAPQLVHRLHEGATTALLGLSNSLRKYSGSDHTDVSRVSKIVLSMGVCLEATIPLSVGDEKNESNALHGARLQCVDSLFSLIGSAAYRKHEEIALEAGEALAAYAWVPKGLVWQTSLSETWPAELDLDFAKTLPPHQQIIYTLLRGSMLISNPLKRTAYAPLLLALVARASGRVNQDSSYAHTSLVQEVSSHLQDFQSSFIAILADPKSKHLCRESCCLGLAACRSLARLSNTGDEVNDKLLRAFGQTTNFGTSAMQETQDQANRRRRQEGRSNDGDNMEDSRTEAEVGGTSGMSEAALGAYREMASAAVSLGRPDVLYALFLLSVTHPIWFSKDGRERYGPSALLGENSIIGSRTNAAELRQALRPHLGKIMPRLLRASHDPNKQTREQIKNLWNGLTGGGAEARLAISQHLLPIMDSLLLDTSHKLWRARVGATGALAQVIVGRSWTELGGGPPVLDDDDILSNAPIATAATRLLKLWFIAVRALDDVRAAVRESGEALARGVRSLTLRLCDPTAVDEIQDTGTIIDKRSHLRDSSAAAATTLRWLIKHGLNQPCPEATGVCVSCLVGVITVVNPSILQPLIPDLLRSLLLAMSSLEPAALSYLQVRAAGQGTDADSSYGTLERLRIQAAQTGPLATAVTKLLDMVPQVDLDVQKAIIPQLNSALSQSAGFTTRAAIADACSTLCSTCPHAFKFSGPNNTNPSVGLLKGFYHGAERESGAAARSKMAHAFGNLAALCPGSSVRALALRACKKYNLATGANHDPSIRLAAAIALRSIAIRAQNQFSDGGNNDIWCKRVLPVSYIGMRDSDQKIAKLWKEVWEEGGSAANLAGAVDDFGSVLEEKLLVYLVKECSLALADVSWSRRAAGAAALKELADARILAPIPHRKRFSKSVILSQELERFQRRSLGSTLALSALVKVMAANRLWSGKSEVAKATAKIAANWSSSGGNDSELLSDDNEYSLETPISLVSREKDDDLFIGDAWFRQEHDEAENDIIEETETSSSSLIQDTNFESDAADLNEIDEMGPEPTESTVASAQISFVGLCRLFLTQAFPTTRAVLSVSGDEVLPFRAAVLQSLSDLLGSLDDSIASDSLKKCVFRSTKETILSVFTSPSDSEGNLKEPPLFVARCLDSFAAIFWSGIGSGDDKDGQVETLVLAKLLLQCLEQPAWTVRESAILCCSSLVLKSHPLPLSHYETISIMVACVSASAKDRKFWRVRLAGIRLLHSLVIRTGKSSGSSNSTSDQERQELLESMLPHKEKMLKLAKYALGDPEAKVTALASEIVNAMAWWP